MQKIPRGLLEQLTEIDQRNHVAWMALDPSPPNPLGLGIARFVRLPGDPSTAEVDFVVIAMKPELHVPRKPIVSQFDNGSAVYSPRRTIT